MIEKLPIFLKAIDQKAGLGKEDVYCIAFRGLDSIKYLGNIF